jgi:hypothetical protein
MKTLKFNNKFNAHQGDIEIFSINSLPDGIKKIDKTFIAKSEKSGHCHAMCGDYELYELADNNGFVIEVGTDGCTLNHTRVENLTPKYWNKNQITEIADHKPTILEKGLYFIGIQKRKKHFSKLWEKVKD